MRIKTPDGIRPALATAGVAIILVACGGDEPEPSPEETEERVEAQSFVTRPDLTPPVIDLEVSGETAPGLLFIAPKKAGSQTGPLILDNDGDVVWTLPREHEVTDFRVQEYAGEPVLTWWEGEIDGGRGVGEFVIMDASYQEIARVEAGPGLEADLHEFQLTDDGTALIMAYENEPADLSGFGGAPDGEMINCYVQEIDVATGDVVFTWSAREHLPMSDTYEELDDEEENEPFDWFHGNSVAEDGDDRLLVSARNTHAVYSIDRRTGEVLWVLGGKSSDFPMNDDTTFAWQHDARRMPDGTISIFDNEASPAMADESRAITLKVDGDDQRVTLADEYRNPEPVLAGSQGNAQIFDDGRAVVGWGSQGQVTEFDDTGRAVARLSIAPAETYRAYRMPWRARPSYPPDVAAEGGDGGVEVFMSWNGSTEVREWRVRGGDELSSLEPLATVGKDGFETSARVDRVRYVVVEALDAHGDVLDRSEIVPTD